MKNIKKLLALMLTVAMLIGVTFVADIDVGINTDAATASVVWNGTKAAAYSGGNGTKENPFIIKTPMQLYKMVLDGGKMADGTQGYYKVADGVTQLNLSSNILKTAAQIKAAGDSLSVSDNLNWTKTSFPAFKGNFDGNGVTVTGMISKSTSNKSGLIPWLGTYSVVKNINFDGCYVSGSTVAVLSSNVSAIKDDDDDGVEESTGGRNSHIVVHNIAVVNSAIAASGRSGGVIASNNIADSLHITTCLYDGNSCVATGTDFCGVLGGVTYNNNFSIYNSVSIGAPVAVTLKSSGYADNYNYNDYSTNNRSTHPIFIYYSYSDKDLVNLTTDNVVSNFNASTAAELMQKLPLLDWTSGWYVGTRKDGTLVPMVRVRTAEIDILSTQNENKAVLDYNARLGSQNGFTGANIDGLYDDGAFGWYYDLLGDGSKDNPYIINTALQLARVIGAGGKNHSQKLYFKLGNDIDLEGFLWLNALSYYRITDTATQYYKYVPFEGVLDGDGHTVSGLYAVGSNGQEIIWNNGADQSVKDAGLIPTLDGGTVKNLHIRNSHIGSIGNAGAIAGSGNGVIEGCSVENSTVIGNTGASLLTAGEATVKNSYDLVSETAIYFDDTGNSIAADNIDYDSGVWYKGGSANSTPKLINHAKAMPYTDVDGDGDAYENNNSGDLVALRNKLLYKPDFADIYGDVNNDGVINIGDLVVLRREIAGSYNELADGFWRNTELGNVEIFYGENDNYDAARKIESFIETLYDGVDVQKYVSNASTVYKHSNDGVKLPDGKLDIVVGYIGGTEYAADSEIGANQYRIKFDDTNNTLWLQGENFTAVEQAVIDFIADANAENQPSTTAVKTLLAEKQPVTADGKTYYYAWGDEFDGTESDGSGMNYSNWYISEAHSEGSTGVNSSYLNQQLISTNALDKLVDVSNGKLTLKRGFRSGAEGKTANTANGYVCLTDSEIGTNNGIRSIDSSDIYFNSGTIKTANTMMFKQGYVEIMASLPADGRAFPALWLYGAGNNRTHINQGWSDTLFSKIYAENPDWNGTDSIDWNNTATQKYVYPTNYFELDILELMQNRSNNANPVYDYDVKVTIHKWNRDRTHNEVSSNSNTWYSFRRGDLGNSSSFNRYSYNSSTETTLQTMRKYGFLWYTTEGGTTLKTIIYNADGNGKNVTIDASPSGSYASEIINEYMYILIDNEFYSAYNSSGTYKQYTNVLSTSGNQSYLEVDYVRLYQLDGKRDIVTAQTEAFNNGNHFGY